MEIEILYEKRDEGFIDILLDCNGFIHYKINYSSTKEEQVIDDNLIEVFNFSKRIDENPLEFLFKHILSYSEIIDFNIVVNSLSMLEVESFLRSFVFVLNRIQKHYFEIKNDDELMILHNEKIIYSTNIPIKTFLLCLR